MSPKGRHEDKQKSSIASPYKNNFKKTINLYRINVDVGLTVAHYSVINMLEY